MAFHHLTRTEHLAQTGPATNILPLPSSSGSSVAAFDISDASTLAPVQAETYTLDAPGPNPERQDAPHPHQALLDPTGQYLLVPDLGSDVIRLYSVGEGGLSFTELEPLAAVPGSGPRHGVFLVTDDGTTYFYLASELANTVTGFEVTYNDDNTLDFTEVYLSSTHGLNGTVPNNETTAAEIAISVRNFVPPPPRPPLNSGISGPGSVLTVHSPTISSCLCPPGARER